MRLIRHVSYCGILTMAVATLAAACSSSNSNSDAAAGTGGAGTGTGGASTSTGGSGTGGRAGGTGGASASTGGNGGGAATGGRVGTGGTAAGGAGGGGGQSAFSITSTAVTEGQPFPAENTCAGANTSPPLTWTAGPTGTMSYAVLLTDLSITTIHWVIWDIPAATRMLPAALANTATLTTPAGAKQAHYATFFGTTDNGYRGPCPSGALHNYQFEVHALDVATLPTVTTASAPMDVLTQITAHTLAHADLTGTSTASMAGQ